MSWLALCLIVVAPQGDPSVAAVESLWRVRLDSDVSAPPVVCGDQIVVPVASPPALDLLRRADGKRLMRITRRDVLTPALSASDDRLAWCDGAALLIGHVHTGRIEVSQRHVGAQPWAAPLLVDGVVYAVSAGRLVCLDSAGEAPRWSCDEGFLGTPAMIGERLFVVRQARGELTLVMRDPRDGRDVDHQPTGLRGVGAATLAPLVVVSSSGVAVFVPGLGDDEPNLALLTHDGDRLRAVNTTAALAAPTWLAGAVLAPVPGDPTPRWHAATPRARVGELRDFGPATAPFVAATVSGDLLALGGVVARASSGRVLWRGPVATQRPLFDGDLLVVPAGRDLHGLRLRAAPASTNFAASHPQQLADGLRWIPSLVAAERELGVRAPALQRTELGVVVSPSCAVFVAPDRAAQAIECATHGEGVLRALAAAFAGRMPKPPRIHVELFADRGQFAASAAVPMPVGDDARAEVEAQRRAARAVGELRGYFAPDVDLTRLWLPPLDADLVPTLATLAHELTHHWLHAAAAVAGQQPPRLRRPGFFCVEGFATFAESLRGPEFNLGAELSLLVDACHHATVAELLSWDDVLRVDQLTYHTRFTESARVPYRGTTVLAAASLDQAALFAGQAGALCRHLWSEPTSRAALLDFVASYYLGQPTRPLTEALESTPAQLGAGALRR